MNTFIQHQTEKPPLPEFQIDEHKQKFFYGEKFK